jgi:hypothetical protein
MSLKRADASDLQLGQVPKDIISDTTPATGKNYGILHAVTDVVFASMTDAKLASGSMAGVTLKAGDRYFGEITDITLTSGVLICYNR